MKNLRLLIFVIYVLRIKYVKTIHFILCNIGKLIQNHSDIAFFGIALNVDDVGELSYNIFQPHGIDFRALCSSA